MDTGIQVFDIRIFPVLGLCLKVKLFIHLRVDSGPTELTVKITLVSMGMPCK